MAWGKRTTDDLGDKLRSGVASLFVLPFRLFGEAEAVKFADALATNATLTEFHASGKHIGVEGARAIGAALKSNTTLTSLCIGDGALGNEGLQALCEGLRHNAGLQVLDLENKGINSSGANALAAVLAEHPALSSVTVSRNSIGSEGLAALAAGLSSRPVSPLTRFTAFDCELSITGLGSFNDWLRSPGCQLVALDLSGNNLSGGDAEMWSWIVSCGSLESLRLVNCNIGAEVLASLCTARGPVRLKEVSLSHNPDTGRCPDFGAVTRGLSERSDGPLFPGLERLNLEGCSLGNEGLALLVGSLLRHAPSLHHLDVSGNALTCDASPTLVSLAYHVHYLRLFNNAIADAGIMALLQAVLMPLSSDVPVSAVKYLDLGGNAVTDDGVSTLVSYMRRVQADHSAAVGSSQLWHSLETLELVANTLSEAGEAALRQLIEDGQHCGVDIVFQKRAGPGES